MRAKDGFEFVDSNVFVYLHDRSAGAKHERARELVSDLWADHRGCLSIQVLQEVYVNLTQKVPKPLARTRARRILAALGAWRTHRPALEDVLSAVDVQRRYEVSFWDALILTSARALGRNVLWSEDLNSDQNYAGVRVRNPF